MRDRIQSSILSPVEIDYLGLLGEYATAEALGLSINEQVTVSGDSGQGDLLLPDGRTVGVKTRLTRGRPYRLPPWQEFMDDYGVLCWPGEGIDDEIEIAGSFSRQMWRENHYLDRHGYLVYPVDLLQDIQHLRHVSLRLQGLTYTG